MADRTVLDEAAAALAECDLGGHYREAAAVVLTIAADRLRAIPGEWYPEDVFPPGGTSKDAISAAAMRRAYRTAADLLAEGDR